jgi:hypothetical protein
MKRPFESLAFVCRILAFASAPLLYGCVGLDKPAIVEACAASSEGCVDHTTPKSLDAAVGVDSKRDPDANPGLDASIVLDGGGADGMVDTGQDLVTMADISIGSDLPLGPDLASTDLDTLSDAGDDLVQLDAEPANCITKIISNGYKSGSVPACSACNDGNGSSLAAKCTAVLDCLLPPRTSLDFTYCQNSVGGSSRVRDCASALAADGCPNGY